MEDIDIIENEHFTVNRDTDDDIYMCNFCLKVIKAPMATALFGPDSIWHHIKYAHPDFITKIRSNRYLSRRRSV